MTQVQPYDYYKTLATPSQVLEAKSAAPGIATVTVPAPPSGQYQNGAIYITAIEITGSAAPAAAIEVTLTGLPGAVTLHWEIPAQAFAPIYIPFGTHGLQMAPATAAVLTIPSLGNTSVSTGKLYYYYAP